MISKKITKYALALTIFAIAIIAIYVSPRVYASTRDELLKRKEELDRQQKQYQATITELRKNGASLKNEIALYEAQIASTELAIRALATQIEDANLQIEELEKQIAKKEQEITSNKKVLSELILELYQMDANSALTLGLGSSNFSDFLDQMQYTQTMQGKVHDVLENIKVIKAKLETQQTELEAKVEKLKELKTENEETQAALSGQRKNKQNLLDQTKGKESNYQKLLSASRQETANIEKEIEELNRQAQNSGKGGGIKPSKGVLGWPMDGVLTQGYGNTGFRALGYSFHNGIDIAAPAGKPIYAPADGTVLQCESNAAAYGNWCALKMTVPTKDGPRSIIGLFAHMRSYKVGSGQKLKYGDLIGYEGNTGNTTRLLYGPERGYHLHFTIFDENGYSVVPGAHTDIYGPYNIPTGFTYNPLGFLE